MSYTLGATVKATINIADDDNVLYDPTTVVIGFKGPDDPNYRLPTVTKSAVGIYYASIVTDQIGNWSVMFKGFGSVPAEATTAFNVIEGS